MPYSTRAREVTERRLDLAPTVGRRWQLQTERRAETVRRLKAGGPEHADTPERVARYRVREAAKRIALARAGITEGFFTERKIGRSLDIDDFPPNEAARIAGLPVGRIVDLDDRGRVRDGFATGFLIAPNLMITNHHVFAAAAECATCGIQFGFERQPSGALGEGTIFRFDTSRFFYADKPLDFAIVGVSAAAEGSTARLADVKTLPLIPATGKILVGQPVSIIQHPDGGPKKYGVRDNELLVPPVDGDLFLQYSTDTLPGSSGSPAYNKDWEVIGLHHSGVPEIRNGAILTITGSVWTRGMPDSEIHWVANEGIRASVICTHLAGITVPPAHQPALRELLTSFGDDLTQLPAIRSEAEGTRMDATHQNSPGAISIVVNGGTVTFNIGQPTLVGPAVPASLLPVPTPLIVPVVEKKLRFDPDYDARPGYERDFLGLRVPPPRVAAARLGEILKDGDSPLVLKYHHYSLVMNKTRRLVMWAAVNADYTASKRRKTREEFGTDTWVPDPRIPAKLQIEDPELYDPAKKFDRGHIIRRDDTAWGETLEEETLANSDSFHWTNCTPQHEEFNRDQFGFHGLWGGLENRIASQAKHVGFRMSIFAGPILDNAGDIDHDFGAGMVKVPRRFWKVLVVAENHGTPEARLRTYGFILDQSDAIAEFGIERFDAGTFKVFQHSIPEVASEADVTFDAAVVTADAIGLEPHEGRRRPLESLNDVKI